MPSNLNVTGLVNYVNQLAQPLIKQMIAEPRAVAHANVMVGNKYKQTLNLFDSAPVIQDGSTCAFSPLGSVSLAQKEVSVAPLKINEEYCLKDLETKYIGLEMRGSYNEAFPAEFNKIFIADKVAKIQKAVEYNFVLGSTTGDNFSGGTSSTYNKTDGILQTLINTGASASTIKPAGLSASLTATNILANVELMIASMPDDILDADNLEMWVSNANFNLIQRALIASNNYHFTALDAQTDRTMVYPGSNVTIVAIAPMPSSKMFLTYKENVIFSTDMLNEEEKFEMWWSQDNQTLRFNAQWKQGATVAYPNLVVVYNK